MWTVGGDKPLKIGRQQTNWTRGFLISVIVLTNNEVSIKFSILLPIFARYYHKTCSSRNIINNLIYTRQGILDGEVKYQFAIVISANTTHVDD